MVEFTTVCWQFWSRWIRLFCFPWSSDWTFILWQGMYAVCTIAPPTSTSSKASPINPHEFEYSRPKAIHHAKKHCSVLNLHWIECPRMQVRFFFGQISNRNKKSGTFGNETSKSERFEMKHWIKNMSLPIFHFKIVSFSFSF